jgi:hypothetical protein
MFLSTDEVVLVVSQVTDQSGSFVLGEAGDESVEDVGRQRRSVYILRVVSSEALVLRRIRIQVKVAAVVREKSGNLDGAQLE